MRRLITSAALLCTLACGAALTGCVPQASPGGAPAASATPTSNATASSTAAPAEPAEPGAVPVDLTCDQVLTPQQMFDYNSIYSAVDAPPQAGSAAASAVEMGGVACSWVNTSSGSTIEISVAQPAPAQWASLRDAAAGFEGGVAQAFPEPYWVTVGSSDFVAEEDAIPLIDAVVGNLG